MCYNIDTVREMINSEKHRKGIIYGTENNDSSINKR